MIASMLRWNVVSTADTESCGLINQRSTGKTSNTFLMLHVFQILSYKGSLEKFERSQMINGKGKN